MKNVFLSFVFAILISSCGFKKEAALNNQNIVPGITKNEAIKILGKPNTSNFHYDFHNRLVEELIYYAPITEVEILLIFLDGKLVQKQQIN